MKTGNGRRRLLNRKRKARALRAECRAWMYHFMRLSYPEQRKVAPILFALHRELLFHEAA